MKEYYVGFSYTAENYESGCDDNHIRVAAENPADAVSFVKNMFSGYLVDVYEVCPILNVNMKGEVNNTIQFTFYSKSQIIRNAKKVNAYVVDSKGLREAFGLPLTKEYIPFGQTLYISSKEVEKRVEPDSTVVYTFSYNRFPWNYPEWMLKSVKEL